MNRDLPGLAAPRPRVAAEAVDVPWAVTAPKVEAVVERIAAAVKPMRILAFGSRARGDAGPDSDLDLLVVLPRGQPEAGVSGAIRGVLRGLLLCVDVVVVEEGRFERLRRALNTLYREADREGVELYADGTARRDAIAQVSR
jgi:uncharacterized protein